MVNVSGVSALDLDQRRLRGRPAGGEVGTEEVAVAGDRSHVGQVGHEAPGRGQVINDRDLEQQSAQCAP